MVDDVTDPTNKGVDMVLSYFDLVIDPTMKALFTYLEPSVPGLVADSIALESVDDIVTLSTIKPLVVGFGKLPGVAVTDVVRD